MFLMFRLDAYDKLEKLQVVFYVLSDALKDTDVTQIRDSWPVIGDLSYSTVLKKN